MPHGADGALHDENVRACFLGDPAIESRLLRNGGNGGKHTGLFDLAYPGHDEVLVHRFLIDALQQARDLGLIGFENLMQHFLRVFVAGLDTFQIQDRQAAQLAHLHGKRHVHNPVHRAGEDGNAQAERFTVTARDDEGSIDLVGVDGYLSGDERDLVEPVGHSGFTVTANPHAHRKKVKTGKRSLERVDYHTFVGPPASVTERQGGVAVVLEFKPTYRATQPKLQSPPGKPLPSTLVEKP